MDYTLKLFKGKYGEIAQLFFRNIFILVNVVIFSVVVLLVYFGEVREGMFLGVVVIINIVIGIFQEVRAWLVLEKLNLLTALYATRMNSDGTESRVLPGEIEEGDVIKLKLGDQVPCDGALVESQGLEVNTALITGESTSLVKSTGDEVLAGSIVTAGTDLMRATATFEKSRIAKMTAKIKKYSRKSSPIQESINVVIKYAGFILLVVISLVVARGMVIGESPVLIVESIGALASVLVPQGLAIAITLLFAYGATHLLKKHVLLQEMNAVEKLGHIKNLCMDKTGTLTENIPKVEDIHIPVGVSREEVEGLAAAYVELSGDSSETFLAIKKFINQTSDAKSTQSLPFSSSRRYGGVVIKDAGESKVIFLGAPETFLQHLGSANEKLWLDDLVHVHASLSKRIVCLVRHAGTTLPADLADSSLSILGVFILQNDLREGVREAVNFFQDRGVRIRIISGDNPETVHGVVIAAGINHAELKITGDEMEKWNEDEFEEKVKNCTIFARIKPEQKEKIIQALKKDGFTAMIGDGANDALAIKTADLGIAMFDGSPATRRLAAVVLTRNSFAELPGGAKFADSMLENIETYSSMFFNHAFLGFFLFVMVSLLGYHFPFKPLNITFINYFTIGIPSFLIFYWTIRPRRQIKPIRAEAFLKRVMLFPLVSSVFQAFGAVTIFVLSLAYFSNSEQNISVSLAFIMSGLVFFFLAQRVYGGATGSARKIQFLELAVVEGLLLYWVLKIPFVTIFFNVTSITTMNVIAIGLVTILCGFAQYQISKYFFKKYQTN